MLQARLKDGDRQALAKAYQLYYEKTYALAFRYTGSANISSDVVQDTFLKLWSNRSNISLELPLEQQVFVIAKNVLYDSFRKRVREEKLLESYNENIAVEDQRSEEFRDKRISKIYSIIDKLPPRQKEIFELSRFQGLTYEEIGEKLNLSKHTVSSHISAALKTIKNQLSILLILLSLKF